MVCIVHHHLFRRCLHLSAIHHAYLSGTGKVAHQGRDTVEKQRQQYHEHLQPGHYFQLDWYRQRDGNPKLMQPGAAGSHRPEALRHLSPSGPHQGRHLVPKPGNQRRHGLGSPEEVVCAYTVEHYPRRQQLSCDRNLLYACR